MSELEKVKQVMHRNDKLGGVTHCDASLGSWALPWLSNAIEAAVQYDLLLCNECWYTATMAIPEPERGKIRELLTARK